jgi:hypothetical protein
LKTVQSAIYTPDCNVNENKYCQYFEAACIKFAYML